MSKIKEFHLFAGIGGIDLAFAQGGFKVLWANERDHDACITYRLNNPDTYLLEMDISEVSANMIPKADIIAAGFPCQSFSIMGYKRGFKDPRGNLFFEIARIAESMKPSIIVLENVKNLIYHDKGRTFIIIHNTLAELGYAIRYSILGADTHGDIPQKRDRTFVVAFRDIDLMNNFSFPQEIPLKMSLEDIIDRSIKHNETYY